MKESVSLNKEKIKNVANKLETDNGFLNIENKNHTESPESEKDNLKASVEKKK